MISTRKIKEMAGYASFTRGIDIYNKGKVHSINVFSYGGYDEVNATVRGSGGNVYWVTATIDPKGDEVNYISCDCRAFREYDGICKHCVATLFSYNDYTEMGEQVDDRGIPMIPGVHKGMEMHTSPELSMLFEKQAVVKSLPMFQADTFGKVHLEPTFDYTSDIFNVEFKIGVSKMYVLKDVFRLDEAIWNQENYKYGKNLQFVHTEESFDEESRPLLRFIRNWVRENRESHRQRSYYGYRGGGMEKVRCMDLSGDEIANFFLLMEGRKIPGIVRNMPNNIWETTREKLPRKITITGAKRGIEIQFNKFSSGAITDHYRVYFYDNKVYVEEVKKLAPIVPFLNALTMIPGENAFIEDKDIPAFCKDFLPSIQKFYQCDLVEFNPRDYGMLEPKFRIYLDAPQDNLITCRPVVCYGEQEFSVYTTEEIAMRDMAAEQLLVKLVDEFTNAYDPDSQSMVIADDEELMYEFLTRGILALQDVGEVYISDMIKRMEVRSAPKVSVGVSLEGNLLELSMTAGDMSKEELFDILSRYNKKKKFYRLKDGTFVNAKNSGLDTMAELKNGLQITDKQLKMDKVTVPKYRALYLDAQLKDDPTVSAIKNRSFRSLIRNMKTIEDNDFEVPDTLQPILRDYQAKGFLWIKTLCHNGFGGILADDMGLGKTLQVIAFLLSEKLDGENHEDVEVVGVRGKNHRNALIVAPASLVYNWRSEILHFASELSPRMITGSASERARLIEESGKDDILLTSYDLLKRDIEMYENYEFNYQIIDEAQYIKNANTQAARAVKEIQAGFKLALTGTPVENRLGELWSIFDYLMPGFLYGYKRFREEIEVPVVQNSDEDAMKRLQKMIRPFVLRRLKKDVLTDLPDKLEENMYVQLEGEQQKLYDAHVQRMKIMLDKQSDEEFKSSKITILSELTRLRQICCDPSMVFEDYKGESAKVDMCIDLLINAVESGHKILLFSQFTTMLDHLAERLKKKKINYYMLTGATSKEKRAQLVEAFNTDDVPIFCISLKAGGTGLNLTAADIVIHFDPWWNLAVQNQATDRAHRIGQKNVVNVYKLIVKDTIEENIIRLQDKKRELADQILDGDGLSGGSLTKDELLEIIGS